MRFCRSHFAVYFNFTLDQLMFSNDKLRSPQLHPSVTWNVEGSNWRKMLPMDFECKACLGFSSDIIRLYVHSSCNHAQHGVLYTLSHGTLLGLTPLVTLWSPVWLYGDPGTPGSRVPRLPTWVVAVVILSLGLLSLGLSGKNLGLGQDKSSSVPHHSARFPWWPEIQVTA